MSLGETPVQEMADQLGVSRATISRWMGDKGAPPKRAFLAQWALVTDVPIEWLEAAEAHPEPPDGSSMDTRPYPHSGHPFRACLQAA